jgi:hypothetical protein
MWFFSINSLYEKVISILDLKRDLVWCGMDGMLEYPIDKKYILNLVKVIDKLSMDVVFYD